MKMTNQKNTEKTPNFLCNICDFRCFRKTEYPRHLETIKHKRLTETSKKTPKYESKSFVCICGNKYNHSSSLAKHKRACIAIDKPVDTDTTPDLEIKETEIYKQMHEHIDSKTDKELKDLVKELIKPKYNELCYDKNLIDYPTAKSIEYLEEIKYISIDLRSANWVALKHYDPNHINELGSDYIDFLSKFNLPKVFLHSKYLRQFIFGNVNPKRLIKVQRHLIQEMVRKYQDKLQVEGVRNDEVIFSFKNFKEIESIYGEIDHDKYKTKIFTIERVEDFRIDTSYNVFGEILHKEMMGVDGTLFYIKLKEYITGEKLDIRDLYFRSNGRKAIWAIDNLKVKL